MEAAIVRTPLLVSTVLVLAAVPLHAQERGWFDVRLGAGTAQPYGTPPSAVDDFRDLTGAPSGASEWCGDAFMEELFPGEADCTVDSWGLGVSGGWRPVAALGVGAEFLLWGETEELTSRIWQEHNTRTVGALVPTARLYPVPKVPVYATAGVGLGMLRAADEWTQVDQTYRDKTVGLAVAYGGGATIPIGKWGIELSGLWLRLPGGVTGRYLSAGVGYHW